MQLVAALFAALVERQRRFLLLVCAAAIVMILYGSGFTVGSVLACLGILLLLGIFWFLAWFWLRFFRGLAENGREAGGGSSAPVFTRRDAAQEPPL